MEPSIGVTISGPEYNDADEMLRDADAAMYWSKRQGKEKYAIFDSHMHLQAVTQLRMETELRRALKHEELELVYQPLYRLEDMEVCGFEALIRWNHPEKGLIAPLDFIPIAEESGLIVQIGKWVIDKSFRTLREWQLTYDMPEDMFMSVNVSPRQFWDVDFIPHLKRSINFTEVKPHCISLEVTEGVLFKDDERAIELFHELKELDFHVNLDDFGTGFSSLNFLHRFPFDGIKIDRSFIMRMFEDTTNMELVSTILLLAHKLSFVVTAEGIETVEQANALQGMSCTLGQGNLLSEPLKSDEVENLFLSRLKQAK